MSGILTPEEKARARVLELAQRLTTHFECWIFSDIRRSDAVDLVARALIERETPVSLTAVSVHDHDSYQSALCRCGYRVHPLHKYCFECGAKLEWK